MARIHLNIPDTDLARFEDQARQEGKTLSEWLLDAAQGRLRDQQRVRPFESPEDIREFFQACDDMEGAGTEPDWSGHLQAIG